MRLVSDGINHKLLDDNGVAMPWVQSIAIDPISVGALVVAHVTFLNVALDLEIAEMSAQQGLLL